MTATFTSEIDFTSLCLLILLQIKISRKKLQRPHIVQRGDFIRSVQETQVTHTPVTYTATTVTEDTLGRCGVLKSIQ